MNPFPKQQQFSPFTLAEVSPDGWMKQQMLDDLEYGFAACLDELCDLASSRAFFENYITSQEATAASMGEDNPRSWWDGETQAVWWDGLARMAYLSGHAAAIKKIDGIMEELLQSQDETGYIGIYTEKFRYKHTDDNGEFWTQSRAFVAMLAYYELTGKDDYLAAVEKAMVLTMRHYGPHRSYFSLPRPAGGTCHGLMMVDACEWLYRITGKAAYRDFGIWIYEDYCDTKNVRDTDNQLENLLLLHKPFVWHTPHTTEHLRVPLWVWYASGKAHYRKATENAFNKIERYLTLSGACIGAESIKDMPPLPDMTYEYCAITELLTSLQSAGQKTGLAEMGDKAEWLTFNAAQGARLADGTAINYMSMDNREQATTEGNGGRRKFSPTHADIAVCCNPNAIKLLPYFTSRMWLRLKDTKGVCAFCYGPSELHTTINGTTVTIKEETDFPFSENITFYVVPDEPVEFELRLRIPGWATGYSLETGNAEIAEADGFCAIRKTWKQGDTVTLSFDCGVEPVIACNGEVGIQRGPLLYSLPIAEKREVLKTYGVRNLADISMTPAEAPPDFRIDPSRLDLAVERFPDADNSRPWHRSPIVLRGSLQTPDGTREPVTLVPMGCAPLRQTTFETPSDS